jgi:hypothetical protein
LCLSGVDGPSDLSLRDLANRVRDCQVRLDEATTARDKKRTSKALAKAQLALVVCYRYYRVGWKVKDISRKMHVAP